MAKKKRGRGRPPGKKSVKAKAAPKKKSARPAAKAKRPAPAKRKPEARKALTRKVAPIDLVAGRFCITHASGGLLTKDSLVPGAEPRFAAEGGVEVFAVFEAREEARAVIQHFAGAPRVQLAAVAAPQPPAEDDGLSFLDPVPAAAPEPVELPPPSPTEALFQAAHVAPLKEFFAMSYAINGDELQRSVKWKKDATTLGQAVRAIRDELTERVKQHQKTLKEFDRKVAEARKDSETDVTTAQTRLSRFMKVAATYA